MKNVNFNDYSLLIKKRAWDAVKWAESMYGKCPLEYEDVEAQGYLIYCECLENFDESKNCDFSTYLYIELLRVRDYIACYENHSTGLIDDTFTVKEDSDSTPLDFVKSNYIDNTEYSEMIEEAKNSLSEDAFLLFMWIINREWEKKGTRKPNVTLASEFLKKSRFITEKYWDECKNFWNSKGILCFS